MNTLNKSSIIPLKFQVLSGSSLKIIAIILMLIDHIGAAVLYHGYLLPNAPIAPNTTAYTIYTIYRILRFIGRLAFPIFCFLLVQGFIHTSNKKNYALRLFAFALISEVPFDLAIHRTFLTWSSQNVFFTLLIGFCVLWLIEIWQDNLYSHVIIIGLGMGLAYLMNTDYDYRGIILIVVLYYFRNWSIIQTIGGCLCLLWEVPATLAFIPINMYDGQRGMSLKYFFYIFYPLHLFLLALIRYFLFKI